MVCAPEPIQLFRRPADGVRVAVTWLSGASLVFCSLIWYCLAVRRKGSELQKSNASYGNNAVPVDPAFALIGAGNECHARRSPGEEVRSAEASGACRAEVAKSTEECRFEASEIVHGSERNE